MNLFGQLCLLAAFVGSGFAAFVFTFGWWRSHRWLRRSAATAAAASLLSLTAIVAILAHALVTNDFGFAYVAQYSSSQLPWYYSLSALWVGQAGSLLLWAWLSLLLAFLFHFFSVTRDRSLREPAFGILLGFCCFLIATMVFAADPMAPSIVAHRQGAGLSPLLQHHAMLIHPPIMFIGYAAWSVPCALALAALMTRRLDADWTREARPWVLFAWVSLGAGILLGAHWAYEELGWGGYWGWDPVENGSLIPWLTGTALLHALMVYRYRGALKKTAAALAIATFALCNFATFLTRSGIFSSLHAFSKSPIGWLFLVLMLALTLGAGLLIVLRRANLTANRSVPTLWCRESMVMVSIVALLLLAAVTCFGTLSAALSEAVIGRKVVLGTAFYNNVLIPTGLLLLATMAAAPLLRWGAAPTRAQRRLLMLSAVASGVAALVAHAVGVRHPIAIAVVALVTLAVAALACSLWIDFWPRAGEDRLARVVRVLRSRRKLYAGFLVHVGFLCLAMGVAGSSLGGERHEVKMTQGERIEWDGYHVRLIKVDRHELVGKLIAQVDLEISRNGAQPFFLSPAQHLHLLQDEWTTEVAIHSDWSGDFYTILHGSDEAGRVSLTLVKNPAMRWIWLGGSIMGIGASLGLLPTWRRSAEQTPPTRARRRTVDRGHPFRAGANSRTTSSKESESTLI